MSRLKKILLALPVIFILIQFIRPTRNKSYQVLASDITRVYEVPDSVKHILEVACYDCHSNNTRYPWYNNIQPLAWWLEHHINDAKKDLNFSEFGTYGLRKQQSRFKGIAALVKKEKMPLKSYKWMHKDARLSEREKELVIEWATKSLNSIK